MCKRPSAWLAHKISWAIGRNVLILVYQKVTILIVSTLIRMHTYVFIAFNFQMSMSTLINILAQNPLTGPNFLEWKRNLDFILIAEELKYIFNDETPTKPTDDASDEQREIYNE